ncbi:hypothetical protein YC2023_066337 [Brassica napus]
MFSTHRTSVAVRQHTQDVRGCPCVSVSTHRTFVAVRVCSCVFVCTHRTSVAVHQYTYQHAGPWTQHAGPSRGLFGTQKMSVAVCVCPSAHTGRPWLSVCVRQHTQDVRGCPCVLINTHRTSVAVRVCPTHISTLVLGLSTLTLPMDCSGNFGPCGLIVQYTQDVRGSPLAHTGRLWLSVAVCQHTQDVCGCPCVSVCVRQHTQDVRGCPSVHISTLVLGLSTLALPVDCFGDYGPHGQSFQYTQDVCGCPPAHTRRLWLSVSTHRTSVAFRVCPSVSISTHRTSVAVHQYTYQHVGPWTQHAGPSRGLFGTYVAVCHHTQNVRGCPCVSVGVRQHTQDGRGCQWLSVSTHRTSAHTRRPWLSISTHISMLVHGLSTLSHPVDCLGDFGPRGLSVQYTQDVRGTHRTSVAVRQHTQDVCGCPCVSVCGRVCPSAQTGRLWLSNSTHSSTLVLGLSTLALPVDCSGDFSPRGLSVQYTQNVHGCPSAHTGRPCVSPTKNVRGCPSVPISARCTHRASVAVRQHTQDVRGCPRVSVCVRMCPSAHTGLPWLSISTHISTLVLGLSTLALPVDCSGDFGPHGLSVQYTERLWVSVSTHMTSVCVRQHTQDVSGCPCVSVSTHRTSVAVRVSPSAHIGRSCLSVCVRVCPSAHTGRPWLSVNTHISTLTLPMDCSGDFAPRGLSVQYTQDVCGCPSAHTGRLWVSASTHRTSVAVRVCPSVSISTHRTSVAVHHTHRTSVGVRQHTQDVCGYPWLSVSTNISTLVLGLSTLTLPVDFSGDFGPRGLSVQYTQDVCGCPSAHTGRLWLSVCVRVWPCVSVSTHRTSVAVHQYTYQHAGPWTQHTGSSRGLFG